MIELAALKPIAEKVLSLVWEKGKDPLLKKLGFDPATRAFHNALEKAVAAFETKNPSWTADLFDGSFFEKEGAQVLAAFLLPDQDPSPSDLAIAWAKSLGMRSNERKMYWMRDLEPVAADFLEAMEHALTSEKTLAPLITQRAVERTAQGIAALRHKFDADEATLGTRWDYLHWLINNTQYIESSGTLQTQTACASQISRRVCIFKSPSRYYAGKR